MFIHQSFPSWIPGGCKVAAGENCLEQKTQMQSGDTDVKLLILPLGSL
jgi:hypothetical protein